MEDKIKGIVSRYAPEKRFSLAIMQDIQREFNYIPKEAMRAVSEYLDIRMARLYGMATFYKALSLKPKGKYAIKVCDGTACHIRSSLTILDEIKSALGINVGEVTPDNLFSVETVNCLGACALAPVMLINEEYHGKLKLRDVRDILDRYRNGEANE
ncbi:MAG: NAD(P)H-dependent oxidoreductase subunit E [Synergistaceae bacterium]|jgi:NADH-quinone oxidoreductase subunit E|nr:NAD(P)H-dependent oxidoreductase subunit E [Synergistaceae bacterium]